MNAQRKKRFVQERVTLFLISAVIIARLKDVERGANMITKFLKVSAFALGIGGFLNGAVSADLNTCKAECTQLSVACSQKKELQGICSEILVECKESCGP